MNRLFYFFLTALMAISFASCEQEGGDAGVDTPDVTNVNNPATNDADAKTDADTPPAARRPGYQEKAQNMTASTVEWSDESFNFEKAKSGDIVRHTFSFKNTGQHPIVIQKAKPSCGCTTPAWTKEPVAPGETGKVDIEFNTKGKKGMQNKTVTVTGNFDGNIVKVLKIVGEVLPPDENK